MIWKAATVVANEGDEGIRVEDSAGEVRVSAASQPPARSALRFLQLSVQPPVKFPCPHLQPFTRQAQPGPFIAVYTRTLTVASPFIRYIKELHVRGD